MYNCDLVPMMCVFTPQQNQKQTEDEKKKAQSKDHYQYEFVE